jgi:hypothetical protein
LPELLCFDMVVENLSKRNLRMNEVLDIRFRTKQKDIRVCFGTIAQFLREMQDEILTETSTIPLVWNLEEGNTEEGKTVYNARVSLGERSLEFKLHTPVYFDDMFSYKDARISPNDLIRTIVQTLG